MKILTGIFILANLFIIGFCSTSTLKNLVTGECDLRNEGLGILRPGETRALPGECARVICGEKLYYINRCEDFFKPDGIKVEADLTKHYPFCCGWYIYGKSLREPKDGTERLFV